MHLFWLSAIAVLACVWAASRYGRRTKKFYWHEFWLLLAAPILWALGLSYFYGYKIFLLFFLSMILGTTLEYGVGRAYHSTLNKRLWTYSRYKIGGYTSWLTLPMWAVAGVIFWALGKAVGL